MLYSCDQWRTHKQHSKQFNLEDHYMNHQLNIFIWVDSSLKALASKEEFFLPIQDLIYELNKKNNLRVVLLQDRKNKFLFSTDENQLLYEKFLTVYPTLEKANWSDQESLEKDLSVRDLLKLKEQFLQDGFFESNRKTLMVLYTRKDMKDDEDTSKFKEDTFIIAAKSLCHPKLSLVPVLMRSISPENDYSIKNLSNPEKLLDLCQLTWKHYTKTILNFVTQNYL
jgi:hypothetical protein